MEAHLRIKLDRDSDTLHIDTCARYSAQESEELGDDIVARFNPKTGEIEGLDVLFFSHRILAGDLIDLPITAGLRLTSPSGRGRSTRRVR